MREDKGKREIVPVGGAKQGTESELTCGGAVASKKTGSGGIRRVPVNFSA